MYIEILFTFVKYKDLYIITVLMLLFFCLKKDKREKHASGIGIKIGYTFLF